MEGYKTVAKIGIDEFTEHRSRFIGAAIPVSTEREALDFIAKRKSEFWDAKHNVYAYVLREGNTRRFTDDSEPQGTAGIPTMDAILKNGVTDVCIVTTRYFGGVLLGAGGLVRAYSHAAKIALDAAGIVTMQPVNDCRLSCDYHQYGKLNSLLESLGALDVSADFAENVTLNFSVSQTDFELVESAVTDATSGSIKVQVKGERFAMVKLNQEK